MIYSSSHHDLVCSILQLHRRFICCSSSSPRGIVARWKHDLQPVSPPLMYRYYYSKHTAEATDHNMILSAVASRKRDGNEIGIE